ncbi:unnamed protein product, partial [Ectocarpus sp. 13 AM-2016]
RAQRAEGLPHARRSHRRRHRRGRSGFIAGARLRGRRPTFSLRSRRQSVSFCILTRGCGTSLMFPRAAATAVATTTTAGRPDGTVWTTSRCTAGWRRFGGLTPCGQVPVPHTRLEPLLESRLRFPGSCRRCRHSGAAFPTIPETARSVFLGRLAVTILPTARL